MATIVSLFTNLGVPATGLSPTIRIRRVSDQVLVVTDAAMTEQGDGLYSYDFTTSDGEEYAIRVDGTATLPNAERYQAGSLSGSVDARINTDIPAILVDTDTTIPGLIAALNNVSIADIQTALTNQGYTAARALLLDNLDAAISAIPADIFAEVVDGAVTVQDVLQRINAWVRGRVVLDDVNPPAGEIDLEYYAENGTTKLFENRKTDTERQVQP